MAEIAGGVRLANGLPASGLTFRLLREVFGKEPQVVGVVTTDESGLFRVPDLEFDERTSLVARLGGDGEAGAFLAPLGPRLDAASFNFVAPIEAASVPSEFSRLRAALRPLVGDQDLDALAGAAEDDTRSDISVAHQQTGWDARLIAVAALAAQLVKDTEDVPGIGIDAEAAYALLRAGLPSDRDVLARLPRDTVEAALTKAAQARIVDLDEDEIIATGERFAAFAMAHRLESKPGGGLSSVRELLESSGLPDDGGDSPRRRFQEVLLGTGDAPLWERAKQAGLDDDQIAVLQSQAKLAYLTTNNLPLMQHVHDQSGGEGIAATIEARGWDRPETWKSALEGLGGKDAVPPVYGQDDDAVSIYAEELARRVRVAYPTQVTAALVARNDLVVTGIEPEPLAKTLFAAAQQGFVLGSRSPAEFLREHADVVAGLDEDARGGVTTALETLHRVHQITPSNAAMKVLLDTGLHSAYDVVATSESEFLARYGRLFPSQHQARLVYRKSEQVSAVLYNFHAMTTQAVSSSALVPVQGTVENRRAAVDRIRASMPSPTMESLFGSLDYCQCDHCRSVLSPAAYLVDLLKFLDPEPSSWQGFLDVWEQRHQSDAYPFGTPYDELITRRPDLAHLELTCENTNTVLPTIDLVTEILEFVLAHGELTQESVHDSGMLSSAEVLAEPEFVESSVYDGVLRTAKHPPALPFDLWHETAREFAVRLETPLAEVMAVFASDDADALAAERLGLTQVEYAAITADQPMTDWWTRFGFGSAAAEEATALASLRNAKKLCQALGISYQALVDLLHTRWANPALAQLEVLLTAGLSVADAVTWRANRAMVGVPKPDDSVDQLTWTTVQSAQRRLDAVTSVYGLTGDRTADARLAALEGQLFDQVVVLADPDATCDFDKAFLANAGAGVAVAAQHLAQLLMRLELFLRLQRRLEWSTRDLDAALAAYVPGGEPFGDPLRRAIRHLARQRELAELLEYDGPSTVLISLWAPMDKSLYDALFVAGPARDRDPVFLAPLGDPLSNLPLGTTVGAHVPALQSALSLTAAEISAVLAAEGHDNNTELSRQVVEVLHRHAALARAVGIEVSDLLVMRRLTGMAPLGGGIDERVLDLARTCLAVDRSPLSVAELDLLAASNFDPEGELAPDVEATRQALPTIAGAIAGIETDTEEQRRDATARLVKAVAAAFGRPVGMLLELLAFDSALAVGYRKLTEATDHAEAMAAHELLSRVLLLVDRLGLDLAEVHEFHLTELPVVRVEAPAPAAAHLLLLLEYAALRDEAAGGSSELMQVLTAARGAGTEDERRDASFAILARLTRRTPEVVAEVASALPLDLNALGTVDGVARLWHAMQVVGRAGVPVATLSKWTAIADAAAGDEIRHRIARETRDAVRARSTVAVWQRVAAPVNDRLRKRRRDALVAATLPRLGLGTVEELYQRLLLDPGSEPVLRTSRIRQAISSVQTFIMRSLLGVEDRVHPSTLDADQWAWMRRYRVWEANRKIFLFPENWLEPEFRDDKSHLFQELESTLVQNDVTADLAEDAFLTFLRKLDEIARLEICGMYWDQDARDPGNNTLHVIGRTYGLPRQYFYRRQRHGTWTPWEPMNVEIEGDHLVPVVWRNRLHVFWVTFLEQTDAADASAPSDDLRLDLDQGGSVFGEIGGVVVGVGGGGSGAAVSIGGGAAEPPQPLAEANVNDIKKTAQGSGVRRQIEMGLHWSEFVAGKWSAPTASGFGRIGTFSSRSTFDPASVFVHSSNVYDDQGEEVGVQIHLTGAALRTFLLRGRNSPVEWGRNVPRPPVPFAGASARINHYEGSGSFSVTFNQRLTATDGAAAVTTPLTLTVLGSIDRFSLLPTSNAVTLGGSEIGSLVTPFFLADSRRTFFVEPSVLETTTETFESYLVPDPGPEVVFPLHLIDEVALQPYVPDLVKPDLGTPVPTDNPWLVAFGGLPVDVLTGPSTGLVFGDRILGPRGPVNVTTLAADRRVVVGLDAVRPGSGLAAGGTVVVADHGTDLEPTDDTRPSDGLVPDTVAVIRPDALAHAGLSTDVGALNVIGGIGLATGLIDRPALRRRLPGLIG